MQLSKRTAYKSIFWAVAILGLASLLPMLYRPLPDADGEVVDPEDYLIKDSSALQAREATPSLTWKDLRGLNIKTGKASALIHRSNGKKVRVGGYMVPLEDTGDETVREFLLVPYPLACIHQPAPPPNQIVHVTMQKGKRTELVWYQPIWVYGILKIQASSSDLAEASFRLIGQKVKPYTSDYNDY